MRRQWPRLPAPAARIAGYVPLLLLLGAGTLLSLGASRTVEDLSAKRAGLEFYRAADRAADDLQRRLTEHVRVVDEVALFFDASREVTKPELRRFAAPFLGRCPGVLSVAAYPAGSEPGRTSAGVMEPASGFFPDLTGPGAAGRIDAALCSARLTSESVAAGPFPGPPGAGPVYLVFHSVKPVSAPTSLLSEDTGYVVGVFSPARAFPAGRGDTILRLVDASGEKEVPLLSPPSRAAPSPGLPHSVRNLSVAGLRLRADWRPLGSFTGTRSPADAKLVLAGCLILTALSGFLLELSRRTRRMAVLSRGQAERLATEVRERERAESRYRALFEDAALGIFRSSREGRILEANPAFVHLVGLSRLEDVFALDLARDVYEDPDERERIMGAFESGAPHLTREVVWKRHGGETFRVRLCGRALRDSDGTLLSFETIAEDVSEKAALDEQVRRARKVEAIGRLAGGVAHDFNNLLTVVLGHTRRLLTEERQLTVAGRRRVEEIEECGDRAAGLTRQLLAFGRRQVLRPRILDLNEVVGEAERLLRRLLREDIDLVVDLDPDIGTIRVDPTQMGQVLMNLALNSRDAMPEGGRIEIRTATRQVPEGQCPHGLLRPGRYAHLRISDTGEGMDEETRIHVFEPFFTTRSGRGGTGLGLATVYGIVKQSGGFIFVTSNPGEGAEFHLYFPCEEASDHDPDHRPALTGSGEGTETVLVAEDEESVRELVSMALLAKGYTVLSARDGLQALRLFCDHVDEIDVVVTDMVMPEMGGAELARKVREMRPEVGILCMSGYSQSAVASDGSPASGSRFLEKPFDLDTLARLVREVLDSVPRPAPAR